MTQILRNETGQTLTLKELHERLNERLKNDGHEGIAYQTLSELLKAGDISEQLEVGGGLNARRINQAAVDVLAAFIPYYRSEQGRLPRAASLLRGFLVKQNSLTLTKTAEHAEIVPVKELGRTPEHPNTVALAEAQGRAQGLAMADKLLTPQEAAEFCRVSVRLLRRTVKPSVKFGTQERYRLSDLLAGNNGT